MDPPAPVITEPPRNQPAGDAGANIRIAHNTHNGFFPGNAEDGVRNHSPTNRRKLINFEGQDDHPPKATGG